VRVHGHVEQRRTVELAARTVSGAD
jgi:hypothetical protein